MIICSYCDNEAVMVSGYNYCADHLGLYETRYFERAVRTMFKSAHMINDFLVWAFGTPNPKLSDLAKWHGRIHRGKWNEEERRYEGMSQDDYIRKIASEYMRGAGNEDKNK